jgi:hypothetical protein
MMPAVVDNIGSQYAQTRAGSRSNSGWKRGRRETWNTIATSPAR